MFRLFLYWFLILLVCGCQGEDEFIPDYEVAEEAQVHVSSFFSIAADKGFAFDTSNLIVRYANELNDRNGDPICGNASGMLTGERQNVVVLDPECLAWRHSETTREILIFHELGHIFLERIHFNELLPNGDYASIMFGGNWSILKYYSEDQTKRDYYINELFDPSTPVPDWSK